MVHEEPVTPSRLRPRLPRDLETICLKCLHKEPGRRYVNASALADDLRRVRGASSDLARRSTATERSWRWCRRNPWPAAAAALMTIVAVGSTMAAWIYRQQVDRIDRQLYINRVNLAYRECLANNITAADRLLDDCPPARRGWEWSYCRRLCHEETLTLFQGSSGTTLLTAAALAFSPDGRRIAATGVGGLVRFWDTETGRVAHEIPADGGPSFCLAFRPDGRHIASGDAARSRSGRS